MTTSTNDTGVATRRLHASKRTSASASGARLSSGARGARLKTEPAPPAEAAEAHKASAPKPVAPQRAGRSGTAGGGDGPTPAARPLVATTVAPTEAAAGGGEGPRRRRKSKETVTTAPETKPRQGVVRRRGAVARIPTGPIASAPAGAGTKKSVCLDLLGRAEGASLEELVQATGWQAHSVRGFLSGEVRKRMQRELASDVTDTGERRYRIVGGGGVA